jgi:hypothetical protein
LQAAHLKQFSRMAVAVAGGDRLLALVVVVVVGLCRLAQLVRPQ